MCRLAWALGNDGGVIVLLLELLFLGGSRLGRSSRSVINIRGRTFFGVSTFLRSGLDGILVIILWRFVIMVALALVDRVDPFLEVLALEPQLVLQVLEAVLVGRGADPLNVLGKALPVGADLVEVG